MVGSRAGSPHRSAVRTFHNVEARGSIQFFSPLGRTCHPRGSQPWNLGHAGCLKGSPVRSSVPARRGRGRVSATGGFEDTQKKHEQSTTVARHYQPRSHAPAQRLSLAMCFGPETPNHGCVVAQPKPLHRCPTACEILKKMAAALRSQIPCAHWAPYVEVPACDVWARLRDKPSVARAREAIYPSHSPNAGTGTKRGRQW